MSGVHKRVTVRAHNVKARSSKCSGEDLMARAMQHEIDHLNGILFLAHLSPLKREVIKRKIKKLISRRASGNEPGNRWA